MSGSGFGATGSGAGAPMQTGTGAGADSTANAGQQNAGVSGAAYARPGVGIREADGGWCVSWCKEHYWGEMVAVGWGVGGVVKVSLGLSLCVLVHCVVVWGSMNHACC